MRTITAMSGTVGGAILVWRGKLPGAPRRSPALPGAPRRSPALLAFAAFLAFALAACGSGPLEIGDDAGTNESARADSANVGVSSTDAGAADAEPQCRQLGDGEEFFPRYGDLIQNFKCDRVCHNSAGGFTCIFRDTLQVTDCDACQ